LSILANRIKIIVWKVPASQLKAEINQPHFLGFVWRFLYDQLHPNGLLTSSDIPLIECPTINGRFLVYASAAAMFYASSDLSGIGGMCREHI
jgi:hypothetical protein